MPTITITATAAVLSDQVAWVARVLPARPAIPVLAGLRLDITADRVRVTGTDYDTWAQADVDADTEGEGVAVLPGRLLADLLSRLPSTHLVTLTIDPTQARITCGPTRATVRTLPAEDYPSPPEPLPVVGRAKAADLSAAIAQVAGAASTDPTLAALTCVHTALTEDGIVLTATDRYRVAQQTVAWEPVLEEGAGQQELLVPRPALERAAKSLTGTVSIGVQDGPSRALELSDGTRRVSTQLVDAEFVRVDSYRDRTIKDAAVTVTVAAADLTAAIGRVALFAERNTPIRVEVSADGLVVRASSDGDAGSEEVPAKVDGEHLVVALQANWLGEALAATRSDQVRLAVAHVHRPVLITPDADGDAYWQIVMPVRLGSAAAPGGES